MAYKYYNQNNYASVPYPSPDLPKATVKSGGCGVCCASMIVENLTAHQIGPKLMATYAINKKARVSGGTDMNTLAKAISADYGLMLDIANDELVLLAHLRKGGMAIANVGGNRTGYVGVFSDGGHYVAVAGLTDTGQIIVLDPGYYPGKFGKPGRMGKVSVSGNQCICNLSVLGKDTENRSPAYWLFSKISKESEDDKVVYKTYGDLPDWAKPTIKKLIDRKSIAGDSNGNINLSDDVVKTLVILSREGVVK
jgi:hypothetical protein